MSHFACVAGCCSVMRTFGWESHRKGHASIAHMRSWLTRAHTFVCAREFECASTFAIVVCYDGHTYTSQFWQLWRAHRFDALLWLWDIFPRKKEKKRIWSQHPDLESSKIWTDRSPHQLRDTRLLFEKIHAISIIKTRSSSDLLTSSDLLPTATQCRNALLQYHYTTPTTTTHHYHTLLQHTNVTWRH